MGIKIKSQTLVLILLIASNKSKKRIWNLIFDCKLLSTNDLPPPIREVAINEMRLYTTFIIVWVRLRNSEFYRRILTFISANVYIFSK